MGSVWWMFADDTVSNHEMVYNCGTIYTTDWWKDLRNEDDLKKQVGLEIGVFGRDIDFIACIHSPGLTVFSQRNCYH